MEVLFSKMEGLGNDFVMMDDREGEIEAAMAYPDLARKLCDRHFGIGADGIILARKSTSHDIRFVIINSDGSEPQMCGNGMRCFAKYLYENKILTQEKIQVETLAGTVIPQVIVNNESRVDRVRVDMGEPVLASEKVPFKSSMETAIMDDLKLDDQTVKVTAVSMGNPHAVIFVDDVEQLDFQSIGKKVEVHERFPEKTNVEFIQVINNQELKMRVWERGAGVTLACGTGACASLVAAHLNKLTLNRALVHLAGGDLEIEWDKATNHIFKTGPAREVFKGSVNV